MKVNIYDLEDQSGNVTLVCEKSTYYSKLSVIKFSEDAVMLLKDIFHADKKVEERAYVLGVKTNGKLAGVFELSHGSMDQTVISPRDLFRRLLMIPASRFILAHNHPSGSTSPSKEDISITKRIDELSKMMDISMLDHIIIGGDNFLSMREQGLIL